MTVTHHNTQGRAKRFRTRPEKHHPYGARGDLPAAYRESAVCQAMSEVVCSRLQQHPFNALYVNFISSRARLTTRVLDMSLFITAGSLT